MFRTLRSKLIVLMALLLVISLAATQLVGVVQMRKMVDADVKQRAQTALDGLLGDIRDSFQSEENSLVQFSESPLALQMVQDEKMWLQLEKQFRTFLRLEPAVETTGGEVQNFIKSRGRPDGSGAFFLSPPAECIRTVIISEIFSASSSILVSDSAKINSENVYTVILLSVRAIMAAKQTVVYCEETSCQLEGNEN